jgi:hypothetical protein
MKTFKRYIPLLFVVASILLFNFFIKINPLKEGLDSNLADMSVSFCKKFEGKSSQLDAACGGLTTKNCMTSNCCVWVNGSKCSAGNITGPTYKTDLQGNKITVDNYYYMNKCYGNNCSA